jgi:peptide/nickel transport system permease protein
VAAAVKGGWIDRVAQLLAVMGAAIPGFIVAIVLVFAFAIAVRLFPATGYVSPDQSVSDWRAAITLPVLALLIGSVANAAVQFRGAVVDTLSRDFVRTLRARGISERLVIFRHVLRNAGGPGLTVLSLQTLGLLGGAIFIEQVFALPGLGQLGVSSARQGDVPIVMGSVLVIIVFVLVVNLLGDLANAALNPKAPRPAASAMRCTERHAVRSKRNEKGRRGVPDGVMSRLTTFKHAIRSRQSASWRIRACAPPRRRRRRRL